MLYSIPEMKRIRDVPHRNDYDHWCAQLNRIDPQAFQQISNELDSRFDGRDVDTSSWIPGADWSGTIFQPIYEACGQDEVSAGLFFGLIVWQVVVDRGDCWSFGRYEKDGVPIRGMTYFRITCPQ
jgi:hypothetical protein